MAMMKLLILSAAVLCCSAQYDRPVCPYYSRYQALSSQVEEISSTLEVKIESYDEVLTKLPESRVVVCSSKLALEEIRSLLAFCRTRSYGDKAFFIDKWLSKIDYLIQLSEGLCTVVSSKGPELSRVSHSIVSFKEELYSLKSSFKSLDISVCDNSLASRLTELEYKVTELRRKWEQHQTSLSTLYQHRGRFGDNNNVKGSAIFGNTVAISMYNSQISNSKINMFGVTTNTTNNYLR